jgi:purine-nucleoside phosphorylase
VATTGPSYETPAEIKMFKTLGADMVGMSTVPEAIVANYMGVNVLAISLITNLASGISKTKLAHEEVVELGRLAGEKFTKLVKKIIEKI